MSNPEHPAMPLKLRVFIYLFFAVILGLPSVWLSLDLYHYAQGSQSSDWPSTDGTILSSRVTSVSEKGHSRYTPRVDYSFTVSGKEFESNRITFRTLSASREDALHIANRFLKGETVQVYYNPNDPSKSVLMPGSGSFWRPGTVISVGLLLVFGGLAAYARFGK
jgi:hypothetical protein